MHYTQKPNITYENKQFYEFTNTRGMQIQMQMIQTQHKDSIYSKAPIVLQ